MSTDQQQKAEMDDADISMSESSYVSARADTLTMGNSRSDSEDTLSNLSFDNDIGLDSPEGAGGYRFGMGESAEMDGDPAAGSAVQVKVTDFDAGAGGALQPGVEYRPPSVDFPHSPSQLKQIQGATYMPKEDLPGVQSEDESTSVNSYNTHLNFNGDVRISKREVDQELKNTGGNYYNNNHLKPAGYLGLPPPTFGDPLDSLQIDSIRDDFDDYHEDFFNPLSNELVMQRATSFRRRVKQTFEVAVIEKAMEEIDNLDAMLSNYEEDKEEALSDLENLQTRESHVKFKSSPEYMESDRSPLFPSELSAIKGNWPVSCPSSAGSKMSEASSGGEFLLPSVSEDFRDLFYKKPSVAKVLFQDNEPESMMDIEAICKANAPNLMNSVDPISFQIPLGDEEVSNYFLSKSTVEKIANVFESNNFNNLYTLSGELKHILSPAEIEEIVANKEQLQAVINPDIMAALSWSLNPVSFVIPETENEIERESNKSPDAGVELKDTVSGGNSDEEQEGSTKDDNGRNCFSSATSISNGFHSKESSMTDVSDPNELDEPLDKRQSSNMVPVKDDYAEELKDGFQRGSPMNGSMRRKISLNKSLANDEEMPKYIEQNTSDVFATPMTSMLNVTGTDNMIWRSLESGDDLGVVVEDAGSRHGSEDGEPDESKLVLVRRDSKRFTKGLNMERVVQGLFIESSNPNGTLKRLKVPLNIEDFGADKSLEDEIDVEDGGEAKSPRNHKKRIGVDEKILSVATTDGDDSCATDVDVTRSDVFHSFSKSYRNDDDRTINDDGSDDEVTLDLDTPDDMDGSILEQLDSSSRQSPHELRDPRLADITPTGDSDIENRWKSFRVGASDIQIDLAAIQPYRRVLSHGGYYDAEQKCAIILFSGCYLPDKSRKEYTYLMDHLFLYVLSTLEELIVEEDYMMVYLHGATPASCMPGFNWLKRCYQLVDHRLRKNLKALYIVHPTLWLKTIVTLTKPFVSSKFSKKLQYVNTLSDLCLLLPTEHLGIPDQVLQYDFEQKVTDLKRQNLMS